MNNIMIDIETLGPSPNGLIVSIGAVKFDNEITSEFYANVSIQSGKWIDLEIGADTLKWWFEQNDKARQALFAPEPLEIYFALQEFSKWIGTEKKIIWANGSAFDLAILRNAYNKSHIPCPWKWREEMCMRALRHVGHVIGLNYSKYKKQAGDNLHNALEDAKLQAQYVIDVFNKIKENKE